MKQILIVLAILFSFNVNAQTMVITIYNRANVDSEVLLKVEKDYGVWKKQATINNHIKKDFYIVTIDGVEGFAKGEIKGYVKPKYVRISSYNSGNGYTSVTFSNGKGKFKTITRYNGKSTTSYYTTY